MQSCNDATVVRFGTVFKLPTFLVSGNSAPIICSDIWFYNVGILVMPSFQRSVSVAVAVSVAKYVRITLIRKNSVRTP